LSVAAGFRLQPVLEVAQRHLDVATTELQKLAARRREADTKLHQLEGFLTEYRASLRQDLAQGIESDRLRDFRAFLDKLEQAIALQGADALRCRRAWEAAHRRWLELRARQEALSVLRRRHLAAERTREARGEQKQQDELALRERKDGPLDRS
jgi:flagellar FliJ protein